MEPALLWTVVGVAIGAIAAVYTAVTYYRANPKRRLEFAVEVVRLVSAPTEIKNLDVRLNGLQIPDPHLVTLRVFSNSRADIPSDSFDAARPLVFRVEPGGALLLSKADGGIHIDGGEGLGFEWANVPVRPQLIKKRTSGSITFVSSGKPEIRLLGGSPLIDIDVREVRPAPEYASNPFGPRRSPEFLPIVVAGLSLVSLGVTGTAAIGVIDGWLGR